MSKRQKIDKRAENAEKKRLNRQKRINLLPKKSSKSSVKDVLKVWLKVWRKAEPKVKSRELLKRQET